MLVRSSGKSITVASCQRGESQKLESLYVFFVNGCKECETSVPLFTRMWQYYVSARIWCCPSITTLLRFAKIFPVAWWSPQSVHSVAQQLKNFDGRRDWTRGKLFPPTILQLISSLFSTYEYPKPDRYRPKTLQDPRHEGSYTGT